MLESTPNPIINSKLTSICARRDGNVYQVHKATSPEAQTAFSIISKPTTDKLTIEANPYAPKGDHALVARAMKVLLDNFPGYTWVVEVDDRPTVGMMNIYNQEVNAALWSGAPYGYRLFLKTVNDDQALKCVMRAGGEILERARLNRGWNQGEEPTHVDGVLDKNQPRPGVSQQ